MSARSAIAWSFTGAAGGFLLGLMVVLFLMMTGIVPVMVLDEAEKASRDLVILIVSASGAALGGLAGLRIALARARRRATPASNGEPPTQPRSTT